MCIIFDVVERMLITKIRDCIHILWESKIMNSQECSGSRIKCACCGFKFGLQVVINFIVFYSDAESIEWSDYNGTYEGWYEYVVPWPDSKDSKSVKQSNSPA